MSTESQKLSTTHYGLNKRELAQFVQDLLSLYPEDLMSTMTIQRGKSGVCFVEIVITELSDDTETQTCWQEQLDT